MSIIERVRRWLGLRRTHRIVDPAMGGPPMTRGRFPQVGDFGRLMRGPHERHMPPSGRGPMGGGGHAPRSTRGPMGDGRRR